MQIELNKETRFPSMYKAVITTRYAIFHLVLYRHVKLDYSSHYPWKKERVETSSSIDFRRSQRRFHVPARMAGYVKQSNDTSLPRHVIDN